MYQLMKPEPVGFKVECLASCLTRSREAAISELLHDHAPSGSKLGVLPDVLDSLWLALQL
jgi:hypothetical protein